MKLVRFVLWVVMASALFVAFGAMQDHDQTRAFTAFGIAGIVTAIQAFWAVRDIIAILSKR